jgi:hypothetical protein
MQLTVKLYCRVIYHKKNPDKNKNIDNLEKIIKNRKIELI